MLSCIKIENKIKFTLILLLIIAGITFGVNFYKNSIITIKSFKEVNFNAISAKKDTLLIFDVDETLIQPEDTYLMNLYTEQGEKFNTSLIKSYPEVKDWDYIFSIIFKDASWPLIEPEIIPQIKQLQQKNIPVITLTTIVTGNQGKSANIAEWRYLHLKSLGFEGSFANKIIHLDTFKRHPVFYKGTLCTDLEDKGEVLMAFLHKIDWYPRKVIMFDDSLKNLSSVKQQCRKYNIDFVGYQYKGAKHKPWNEKLIQLQIKYLIQHKKWLSDMEAIKLLLS